MTAGLTRSLAKLLLSRVRPRLLSDKINKLAGVLQGGRPVVGVTDAQDQLVGLLSIQNLGEMMMVQFARPGVTGER